MDKLTLKEKDKLLDEASNLLSEKTSKDYREVLALVNKILQYYPHDLRAIESKGTAYWALATKLKNKQSSKKFYGKALKYFDEVIKKGGKSIHVNHCKKNKWYILEELGVHNDVFYSYLDIVLAKKPNDFEMLWYKAEHLQKKGKLKEAVKHFLRTLRAHKKYCVRKNCPNEFELFNNIGICLVGLKCYREALKYFDLAIKIKQNNFDSLYNKALSHYILKEYNGVMNILLKIDSLKNISREDKVKMALLGSKCIYQLGKYVNPEKIILKLEQNEKWNFKIKAK